MKYRIYLNIKPFLDKINPLICVLFRNAKTIPLSRFAGIFSIQVKDYDSYEEAITVVNLALQAIRKVTGVKIPVSFWYIGPVKVPNAPTK